MKRVVVTGMGVITPIGNSVNDFWSGIKSNKVGIDFISNSLGFGGHNASLLVKEYIG